MKISKELKELLGKENGFLKINNIMYLKRWTKDALGNDVDKLEVSFDNPIGRVLFFSKEITARDTAGIVEEIEKAVTEFSEKLADEMSAQVRSGRWFG